MSNLVQTYRATGNDPAALLGGLCALELFRRWTLPLPRVPGMSTHTRLAIRIHLGHSVERAAIREYLYRWSLTLDSLINHAESKSRSRGMPVWGVPHLLGM